MSPLEINLTTPQTAEKLGLKVDEYEKIRSILGRIPNFTELSVYSVLWSEHCSYKNSILWLKKLPKIGKAVLAAAGEENAGLLDIGNGLAVCFKIESHNHPSAIEPYQGAATGVGGIHRDIFTMGARPIASLNSLRFGDINILKNQKLLRGVVRGIGDYGNSFGVPTVGGEIYFDSCYNTNPLVNAMSVGVVHKDKVVRAIAEGIGNPVFIVGSATGKDGIHGATFASKDINQNSSAELPAIQVGDPFQEKLLLEATLELIETQTVVGMQDMGAAGIACSTSEMSAKGKVGMDIYLDKVPTRQQNMLPFEILLSESQERMLVVAKKGSEKIVQAVFEKWDLPCVQIGEVTDSNLLRYFWGDTLVGEIPAESLVLGGGAPVYQRDMTEPKYFAQIDGADISTLPDLSEQDLPKILLEIVSDPSIGAKNWVKKQYDSTVGAATLTNNHKSDAAIIHIKGTESSLAVSVDCNSRYVKSHPHNGCALAVAEACRNLVCCGAVPLGVTNCLNFGNPYNTEVYYQFANAILGLKSACEVFGIPVTGGNVSFYNQSSDDGPVNPTPTIGVVGIMEKTLDYAMSYNFKAKDSKIVLLGRNYPNLGGTNYLASVLSNTLNKSKEDIITPCPEIELQEELKIQAVLLQAIKQKVIQSAKDISEGGLAIALLESAFDSGFGFDIYKPTGNNDRLDVFYLSENGGRVIVSASDSQIPDLINLCQQQNLEYQIIGNVTDDTHHFKMEGQELPAAQLYDAYQKVLAVME